MSNRSRYGQTVYLPKLKGSRAVPLHRRRLEIGSGGNGYDEDWLQQLLFETPEILPIGEIDPAFAPATPLCRELPTAAGPIDLAYMSEEGRLSIVECKLWRNPEARRDAVSQILDYAKEISRWSYDELNDAVCRAARRSGNTNALFDIVRARTRPGGARQLLMTALEEEVSDYIERHVQERDEKGHALVVRNGRAQARKLTMGCGTMELEARE